MAFRVPTQVPRQATSYQTARSPSTLERPSPLSEAIEDDTTPWVLFSPAQESSTVDIHTASTGCTSHTTGVSRLSDFGSFGTAIRSDGDGQSGEPLDEDEADLDSLDEGLNAFGEPPAAAHLSPTVDRETSTMLPAHDGLGSFHASSHTVQQQLWQHERYNPARRPDVRASHRRSSMSQYPLNTVVEDEETQLDRDRWHRIEQWRLEQSRALMHEIERETRRRRNMRARRSWSASTQARDDDDASATTPRDAARVTPNDDCSDAEESFWRRITRKIIRDLMGIDDSLLSVIFGESLPADVAETGHASAGRTAPSIDAVLEQGLGTTPGTPAFWQPRLLQRIARELGILVHQICEHPGAFTTYLQMSHQISSEYAGMRVGSVHTAGTATTPLEPSRNVTTIPTATPEEPAASAMLSPPFNPTLQDASGREHAAHWGIEEDDTNPGGGNNADHHPSPLSDSARLQQEREYWERELDVMMVFRYIRNRFKRRSTTDTTNTWSSRRPMMQDPAHRAAIIRQHHPLVARAHTRSQSHVTVPGSFQGQGRPSHQHSVGLVPTTTGLTAPLLRQHFRRPGSSCASQSAKRSGVSVSMSISSKRTLTGSSRNYWDIGGSIDSGSAVAAGGARGIGAWGEA